MSNKLIYMIFKNNNNWLRYNALSLLKKRNKGLFESKSIAFLNSAKLFVSDKNQWWLVILMVFCVFALGMFVNVEFLNIFKLTIETAKLIVDQRTTNIATIISITLVVTGFLITNLALKSPLTYQFLFKKSLLYFTLYLTLSTIACFIVLSTFRDSISDNFNFPGTVLAGTYLVIVILFLIGYLFRILTLFTDEMKILKLLHHELITEAKKMLRRNLFKKYALEEFNKQMTAAGAEKFDALGFIANNLYSFNTSNETLPDNIVQGKLIKDINIYRITKYIRKKRSKGYIVYYNELTLENVSNGYNNFWWIKDYKIPKWRQALFKFSVLKSDITTQQLTSDIYMNYFLERLDEYTEKGRLKELNFVLNSLKDIYVLEMQNNMI